MSLSALRRRFSTAMGLSAVSLLSGACAKPGANAGDAGDASPVSIALDAATVTSPPFPLGHGGCGMTTVCIELSKVPATSAPKPFERCALTIPEAMKGSPPRREGTFDEELTKERRAKPGAMGVCCYKAPIALCGGGRPFHGEVGPVLASVVPRSDWSLATLPAATELDLERAERYLLDAAFEHASVASFTRVSLQLLSLGAPPALIRSAHAAALDEIEHARIFLALAERRGAPPSGPGPLAIEHTSLEVSFATFVRETFFDGCLSETRALLELEPRMADADVVESMCLTSISEDETRHAELAWQMLTWAVSEGGAPAREALSAALGEALSTDSDALLYEVVAPCAKALLQAQSGMARTSLAAVG